jgi:hypothetical protein
MWNFLFLLSLANPAQGYLYYDEYFCFDNFKGHHLKCVELTFSNLQFTICFTLKKITT